jgi:hypothetical protein
VLGRTRKVAVGYCTAGKGMKVTGRDEHSDKHQLKNIQQPHEQDNSNEQCYRQQMAPPAAMKHKVKVTKLEPSLIPYRICISM